MKSAIGPLGGQPVMMCRATTCARLGMVPSRLGSASIRQNVLLRNVFGANVRRNNAVKVGAMNGIVCSAAPLAEVSYATTLQHVLMSTMIITNRIWP